MTFIQPARSVRIRLIVLAATAFFTALFQISAVHAASFSAGDLVKLPDDGNLDTTEDSSVYFVGADGKRYAFPNSQAYFTWYPDFNGVKTVTLGEMAGLQLGGNVTYRPGTRLVKITSDPNVYAVEPGGLLRWVQTEAVARSLFGDAWNKRVDDIPDAFFFNYQIGTALSAAKYPEGSVVKRSSDNALFLIQDGTKRKITDHAKTALQLQDGFVLTSADSLSEYPDGSDLADAEQRLSDTSQKTTASLPDVPTLSAKALPTAYFNVGSGDVTLFGLRAASKKSVTIRRLVVKVEATTGAPAAGADDIDVGGLVYNNNSRPNFTRFRFTDAAGGEPFGASEIAVDFSKDQSQTLVFTGTFSIPAGTEKALSFVAHTNALLPTGEGYRVTVVRDGTQVVDAATGLAVDFAPAEDLVGPTLTSLNATVEISPGMTPKLPVYVRGSKGADISVLTFKATTVAPNVITALTVQGYVDEEGTGGFLAGQDADNGSPTSIRDMLPQVSLYDAAGTKLAGPVNVDVAGKATFTGLHYVMTAGTSSDLHVKGDISKTVDIESAPNFVAFDVASASDVTVTDDKGASVGVSGTHNGAVAPLNYAIINKTGTLRFAWAGNSVAVLVGTDASLGTLTLTAKDDGYAVKTLSFTVSGEPKSLGTVRLEYPSGANTVTVKGDFIGGHLTFSNLSVVVPKDGTVALKLSSALRTRDNGAVGGEKLAVSFDGAGPLQFLSDSTGESYDISALVDGGPFSVASNAPSSAVVRYTLLSFAVEPGASADIYRDPNTEVLRFTVQSAATGDAIIRSMVFQLSPQDYPPDPANVSGSNALGKWAKLDGDFADDNDVGSLRLRNGGSSTVIGEDASARIAYSIVSGGQKITSPSTVTPARGDYALLEYAFSPGSELKVSAGAQMHFSFEVNASFFDNSGDHPFAVSLLGGKDFVWSDVTNGEFDMLTGSDAVGLPLSANLTAKY